MEWIEEIQRSLGEPVLNFAQQNHILLIITGLVAAKWFFGSGGSGGWSLGFIFGGDSNDDSDSGGDSGGGDGGGGD